MKIIKPILVVFFLGIIIFYLYVLVLFPLFTKKSVILHMIDPDTYIIKENNKIETVQLIGIDAPEITGNNKIKQCFSAEAKMFTNLLFLTDPTREIRVEKDSKVDDKDVHGRLLRYIYLKDGRLLNEELIKAGLAKESNPQNFDYSKKQAFQNAQKSAQDNQAGIWNPMTCNGQI